MKKFVGIFAALALATSGLGVAAQTVDNVIRQVAVAMPKAREIALQAQPGEIISEKIETREGGSGLRYTFNINNGSVTYEVGIDANTGKVLVNGIEPPKEVDASKEGN